MKTAIIIAFFCFYLDESSALIQSQNNPKKALSNTQQINKLMQLYKNPKGYNTWKKKDFEKFASKTNPHNFLINLAAQLTGTISIADWIKNYNDKNDAAVFKIADSYTVSYVQEFVKNNKVNLSQFTYEKNKIIQIFKQLRDQPFISNEGLNENDKKEFKCEPSRQISWLYPDNGCNNRSDLASYYYSGNAANYALPKIFVFTDWVKNLTNLQNNEMKITNLCVQTKMGSKITNGFVSWDYHVASFLIEDDKQQEIWILDPAMNWSGPLTITKWLEAMTKKNQKTICKTAEQQAPQPILVVPELKEVKIAFCSAKTSSIADTCDQDWLQTKDNIKEAVDFSERMIKFMRFPEENKRVKERIPLYAEKFCDPKERANLLQ